VTQDREPGLLEMPGVGPRLVRGFFAAAADFYRAAPWCSLSFEATIKVECSRFESGPWYAVVMGQSGLTFGMALYDDLDNLKQVFRSSGSDEENARQSVALAVTFDDETSLPVSDLDAIEEHGWVVAGPAAYPSVIRKERGLSMRPPLAWEIELLEGCLRAIPAFVTRHRTGTPAREQMMVPVAAGELTLALSWVSDV